MSSSAADRWGWRPSWSRPLPAQATRSSSPGARSRRTRSSSRSPARQPSRCRSPAAPSTTSTRWPQRLPPARASSWSAIRTIRPGRRSAGRRSRAFLDAVPSDCLVVLDEAYREFNRDPDVPDAVTLYRDRPNVAVLRTFSKAYGLAGLRVGYAVAHPDGGRRDPHDQRALRGELDRPGGRRRLAAAGRRARAA